MSIVRFLFTVKITTSLSLIAYRYPRLELQYKKTTIKLANGELVTTSLNSGVPKILVSNFVDSQFHLQL